MLPQEQKPSDTLQTQSPSDQAPAGPALPPTKGSKKKLLIVILIVIALLAAGGAYAMFGMSDKAEAPKQTAQEQSDQTQPEAEAEASCSEGTTEFAGNNIGVHFCYPVSWGNASLEDGPEKTAGHLSKGNEYVIKFSGNDSVSAGIKTKDWTHNDMGHDGMGYPGVISLADSKRAKEYVKPAYIYVDTEDQFAFIDACLEFCSASGKMMLFYTIALANNDNYGAIEFHQAGDALGSEYYEDDSKDNSYVSYEKTQDADLTAEFAKTDSRFVTLQQVADSVR